ncbi:MAG TPA: VOC family protein [Myxococcota bacterium]|nr:VOC family protein [Myxococcota bacterium]
METLPIDLNQVTLPARDLAESIGFYRRFGLRLIVDSPATDYARFEVPGGDATLSIHVEREPLAGPRAALYFEAADPDAVVARLREAGIEPDAPLEDKPWLWREAGYLDPAGNRLIVYHAGENRKNPPWRVGD